jgi:hypothetical protein
MNLADRIHHTLYRTELHSSSVSAPPLGLSIRWLEAELKQLKSRMSCEPPYAGELSRRDNPQIRSNISNSHLDNPLQHTGNSSLSNRSKPRFIRIKLRRPSTNASRPPIPLPGNNNLLFPKLLQCSLRPLPVRSIQHNMPIWQSNSHHLPALALQPQWMGSHVCRKHNRPRYHGRPNGRQTGRITAFLPARYRKRPQLTRSPGYIWEDAGESQNDEAYASAQEGGAGTHFAPVDYECHGL